MHKYIHKFSRKRGEKGCLPERIETMKLFVKFEPNLQAERKRGLSRVC